MVFNSLYFLLVFLPIALLLYYITPKKLNGEAYALNIEPGKSARFTCSSRDGDYFCS